MELPHKINLAGEDYLTVQQIYRGWARAGVVIIGALLSTLTLAILPRRDPKAFAFAVLALFLIVGTQIVFWTLVYPVNEATNNRTTLPAGWRELRNQWEYSHAANAVLSLIAFIMVTLSDLAHPQ